MFLSNIQVVIWLIRFADVIKRRADRVDQSQTPLVPKWRNSDESRKYKEEDKRKKKKIEN